jgi:L-seryl-tRNA(Ser) seleniumtransferase
VTVAEQLRALPSVDEVLGRLDRLAARCPRALLVSEIRRALGEARLDIQSGRGNGVDIDANVERSLARLEQPSLRRVINATGVVLHTNLGRAPLGILAGIPGYSNLEYDLAEGCRGKRDVHTGALFERLLGCPAIAVNNNAAALYLALHELAAGWEVIVSRGELIEIGDGFRIPDIMQRSGAVLREVGTTNRTTVEDYRDAVTDRTRLLLRVHPSNFRMEGFTARARVEELAVLSRERGIRLYEDLGSGCLVDLRAFGIDEPLAGESLAAGADLVSFSGDKLLGGPQAGILAGKPEIVARLRRNPMFRALRLDKVIYQALEATVRNLLFERWDAIPALRMIRLSGEELHRRAESFAAGVEGAAVVAGESVIGGGSTPEQSLPAWLVALPGDALRLERALRESSPPVIARIERDRVVLDLRTVFEEEEEELRKVVSGLLR